MYHLVSFNFAKTKAPMDDPIMEGFVSASPRINEIADHSPGFVWRYQPEGVETYDINPFEDKSIYITLAVWENLESLKNFVFHSDHVEVFKRRSEWFEPMEPNVVLWWVKAGHIPSVDEAKERLEIYKEKGPSQEAFGFRKPFPAPSE